MREYARAKSGFDQISVPSLRDRTVLFPPLVTGGAGGVVPAQSGGLIP
jgi:hypothetical protein